MEIELLVSSPARLEMHAVSKARHTSGLVLHFPVKPKPGAPALPLAAGGDLSGAVLRLIPVTESDFFETPHIGQVRAASGGVDIAVGIPDSQMKALVAEVTRGKLPASFVLKLGTEEGELVVWSLTTNLSFGAAQP